MIPYCILVIEDDDDRAFMEQLFVDYHRLMYHEIFKLVHNQWAAEDVMQSTLVRLIDKIPELRSKDRNHLVNYIITASKNQSRNYLRDSGRHSTSDLQEFMEYEDPDMDGGAIELQIIKKEDLEKLAHIWPHPLSAGGVLHTEPARCGDGPGAEHKARQPAHVSHPRPQNRIPTLAGEVISVFASGANEDGGGPRW